jgi:hypothetical protein
MLIPQKAAMVFIGLVAFTMLAAVAGPLLDNNQIIIAADMVAAAQMEQQQQPILVVAVVQGALTEDAEIHLHQQMVVLGS